MSLPQSALAARPLQQPLIDQQQQCLADCASGQRMFFCHFELWREPLTRLEAPIFDLPTQVIGELQV